MSDIDAPDAGDRDAAARAALTRLVPTDPLERRRSMQALLRVVTTRGGNR